MQRLHLLRIAYRVKVASIKLKFVSCCRNCVFGLPSHVVSGSKATDL